MSMLDDGMTKVFRPDIAVVIGLNESIVLQQIDYWIKINKSKRSNFRDGEYWVFNTYADWKIDFPFWSESTIKRTINNLVDMKLVKKGNYNKIKIDKTNWYTINYEALKSPETLATHHEVNMTRRAGQNDPMHEVNMTRPIPKITKDFHKDYVYSSVELSAQSLLFLRLYEERFGKHREVLHDPIDSVDSDSILFNGTNEEIEDCFIEYFNGYNLADKKEISAKCNIDYVYGSLKRYDAFSGW